MRPTSYVAECDVCGNGLLRLMQCEECGEVAAVCDECELLWEDIEGVYEDPSLASSCSFPRCPSCGTKKSQWTFLSDDDIDRLDLGDYVIYEEE